MKLSVLGRRLHKLSLLLENPKTWRLQLAGIGPDTLLQFDRPWFHRLRASSILDVGANTGQFARMIATAAPGLPVYAFEPLPDCFEALQRSAEEFPQIRPFPWALGAAEAELTIHRNPYPDSSSLRPMLELHREQFPFTRGAETQVRVRVRTLDSVVADLDLGPRPFIKIDVQGYEDAVLAGAPQTLARAVAVVMEVSFVPLYEGSPSFDALYATMKAAGFQFHGCLSQLTGPNDGALLQGDVLFLRPAA